MSEPRRDREALQELFELAERLRGDASLPALTVRLAQYRLIVSSLQPAAAVPSPEAAPSQEAAPSREATPAPAPEATATGVMPAAQVPAPVTPQASPESVSSSLDAEVHIARAQAEAALLGMAGPATQGPTHRRVTRLATAFVGVLSFVVLVGPRLASWLEPVDLAKGKPWIASSALFPCFPDRIDCGGARTTIFFHTVEENEPWVRFDLQAPTSFSAVTVVNRRDAARDRAFPLALEVSDDDSTWRQVARRDEEFSVWKARFESTTARYVRLKALKRTYLHLDAVRVHP